jgi:FAD/FMN-containing dehydrogenase
MTFDALRAKVKGDVVLPGDSGYDDALKRWSVNSQRKAGAVVFVRDAEDVSEALKYAKAEKLDVAVRGGGHHLSGVSSSEGGLVIDLSRHLNGVKIDPKQNLACVGGGALCGALDKAAIEHGLATVTSSVSSVSSSSFLSFLHLIHA